jgi:hypothetical protein
VTENKGKANEQMIKSRREEVKEKGVRMRKSEGVRKSKRGRE